MSKMNDMLSCDDGCECRYAWAGASHSDGSHVRRVLTLAACCGLAATAALGVTGCKPTDLFTEILISVDATTIDENNPDKTIVNSPDAKEKSDALAALSWDDKSETTEDTQNLVTWSKKPNSALTTHHSYYDPQPLFPGIAASDGVRLVFNAKATLDHSVDGAKGEGNDKMSSVSAGDSGETINVSSSQAGDPNSDVQSGGDGAAGVAAGGTAPAPQQQGAGKDEEKTGDKTGGENSGGDGAGEGDGSGESNNPSDKEGDTTDKYAGFGGSLTVYDPNNAKLDIPKADHIAVIGKRAAVMVQAIGGKGAINAMSHDAYYDKDGTAAKSFGDVFGDECSKDVVLWDADDDSIKDVKPSKLAKALKGDTLIVYDQDLVSGAGDPNSSFFTDDQLKELYAAGVVGFAPLSLDTEYGIVDAAYFIGQALAGSKALDDGWSSRDMASAYTDAVDAIIEAVIATNTDKGNWVYGSEATNKKSTDVKGNVAKGNGTSTYIHSIIATDAQKGLSYSGEKGSVDASDIVLFAGYGQNKYSPLGFWMQAAGVADTLIDQNSVGSAADGAISPKFLTALWGSTSSVSKKKLTGSGGAYVNWHGSVSSMTIGGIGNGADSLGKPWGGGLGSKNMPYLIVSGSSDGKLSGKTVKKAVVSSIKSASHYTPYTAFEYSETVSEAIAPYNANTVSTIGDTNFRKTQNPFKEELAAADAVRVNPGGLIESWTRGNLESVLESAWLASIYSQSPQGCEYVPTYDWSSFEVKIGDETIRGKDYGGDAKACVEALVKQFYSTFYRTKIDYSSVVVDEGL